MSTWDDIRSRSEQSLGGMTVYCGDCGTHYQLSGLPCRKHATPEESAQIDELIKRTLSGVVITGSRPGRVSGR